jgi:uncharacterized damage-inducible protein DinB
MSTFFEDLLDRFHELHADIAKSLEGLPVEALDWKPGPETNSINVLVVHLTGAERYWIEAVALGEPTERVRDEEFLAHGLSAVDLKERLAAEDDFTRRALARFNLPDLEESRKSPRNEKTFNVGWCLAHALEHSALHLGQIQLTRQLWEQKSK